ncbi:glycosyltransferase family 10 [Aquicoccus sp. SU-CL01552]|uniref:glycosyltransferase family 10 domain-containing protein n=1 Tax=Aquicoccus sp. SU-CL01552 TaxID=3127656 RepID=UPI003109F641
MQMAPSPVQVHVFTDAPEAVFIKQFPGATPELEGFRFTFGPTVPDAIDVLIVFNRASYTLATRLPVARTAFIAAEPEVIHPYSERYLDQFGIVVSATGKPLSTQQWKTAPNWYWFAGIDFSKPWELEYMKGYDAFAALKVPPKRDKISVVTSNKVFTDYHRKRVTFLDAIIDKIPDHLEIFGRGYRSVDDKAEALLPCKYHIALENCDGDDTWTEKLADPLLCWAFPFYAGCTNVEAYFPNDSFSYLDLNNPDQMAQDMVAAVQNDLWGRSLKAIATARDRLLSEHSLAFQLLRLAMSAHQSPAPDPAAPMRHIWSEKSLWPESGARGNLADWTLRNTLMTFDKGIELKTLGLRRKLEAARSRRRKRKLARLEKGAP